MKKDKMITMVMVITIATIINRRETHERERGKQLCFDRTDPSVIPPSKFMVCFFSPLHWTTKKVHTLSISPSSLRYQTGVKKNSQVR